MICRTLAPSLPLFDHLLISKISPLGTNLTFVVRLLKCFTFALLWHLMQKRIAYKFGSRVAFANFIISCSQFDYINNSFRLLPAGSNTLAVMFSFSMWLSDRVFLSLLSTAGYLSVLGEKRLEYLFSLGSLYLLRPFNFKSSPSLGIVFVYLSLISLSSSLGSHASLHLAELKNNLLDTETLSILLPKAVAPIFWFLSFESLEIALSFVGGCLFTGKVFNEAHFPFFSLSSAITIAAIYSRIKLNPLARHASRVAVTLFALSSVFSIISRCRNEREMYAGANAAFYLADLLQEDISQNDEMVMAHVSRTVMPLGFAKIMGLQHPKIKYEFGTQYAEPEFLQKFKYRAADINENIDPAFWITHSVHRGLSKSSPATSPWRLIFKRDSLPQSDLQIKILIRKQSDSTTAVLNYYI